MIDLETLLAQLSAGPSDADKQAARAQAAMAMGLGLLGTPGGRRNPWAGIAQGAAMGMGAYNDSLAQARQQPMDRLKAAGAVMDYQAKGMDVKTKQAALDEMERQRQEAAMARDVLRGFQMPAPLPSMAPTNENAARPAATPKAGLFEKLNAQADALEAKGLVQQAQQYRTLAEKYAPQYEGMETVMRDGKPVVLQRFKNRAPEETGYMPKPDYKQVDSGEALEFYDPLTRMYGGRFAKTTTPDANLQAKVAREGQQVTMRGQDKADARAREANLIASAGGGKPTDQQLSAQSFLDRMQNASRTIGDLEGKGYTPGAMGALVNAAGSIPIVGLPTKLVGNAIGNAAMPQWGQYRQAQEEWVRAKLRKESGAVISDSEMEGEIRTYFPQPGDGQKVIEQKARSRRAAEDAIAKQAAGVRSPGAAQTNGIGTNATNGKIGGMSDKDLLRALGL